MMSPIIRWDTGTIRPSTAPITSDIPLTSPQNAASITIPTSHQDRATRPPVGWNAPYLPEKDLDPGEIGGRRVDVSEAMHDARRSQPHRPLRRGSGSLGQLHGR